MQRRVLLLCWLVLAVLSPAASVRAQSPDTEFLRIYNTIQEGESFDRAGEIAAAAGRFREARRELEAFSKSNPSWNRKIIKFRLDYLADKLDALQARITHPEAAPLAPAPDLPDSQVRPATVLPPRPESTAPSRVDDLAVELAAARGRIEAAETRLGVVETERRQAVARVSEATTQADLARDHAAELALELRHAREELEIAQFSRTQLGQTRDRLESERDQLESRLKEALSPKPAALDPAELAKAEDRILLLMKENEILKAGLDHATTEHRKLLEKAGKVLELEQQLASARSELSAQRKHNDELRAERQKLLAKVDSMARKADEQTASLRSEVEALRRELASARAGAPRGGSSEGNREFAALRNELAEQKSAAEKLKEENEDLGRELAKWSAIRVTPASLKVAEVTPADTNAVDSPRLRRLEREREELRRELEIARSELRQADAAVVQGRSREMAREVEKLTAKVAALESRSEPYTAEELALFRAPTRRESAGLRLQLAQASAPAAPPTAASPRPVPETSTNAASASSPAAPNPGVRRRTTKDLPPGASVLATQAERAFRSRRLDDAEKAYRDILKLDESNVFTLANLAAILVELNRLDEAETYLKRALTADGQDAFSLSLLGIIRFRQQKYDEAFEALSRSASLDSESADTQNYLGITLSQRGQRAAAETALRKALKLNPGSASAHYNLSVVYATQKPPFLELARYHYEKAKRGGQPANPAFEALLRGETAGAGAPVPAK